MWAFEAGCPAGPTVLVAGFGNEALRDEGIGLHAVRALARGWLPSHIQVLEGGTGGLALVGWLAGVKRLVLVDAMDMARPPGTVIVVRPEEIRAVAPAERWSLHGMGLLEAVELAGALGLLPAEVYVVGVQPADLTWGFALSPDLCRALPGLVETVRALALSAERNEHMADKKKILIVDDDPDIVEALRLTLQGDYEVLQASNGQEGLSQVKEHNPDLIILDVMMESETEGFQVSLALRSPDPHSEFAAYARIPILMLTAIHQKTPLRFAPDRDYLPVDDFVEKPVKPAALLAKVRSLLAEP